MKLSVPASLQKRKEVRGKDTMKKISYLLILVIFWGCNYSTQTEKVSDIQAITIDLDQPIKTMNIREVSSSISSLRLEESEDNPIGIINKLIVTNTNIYILDWERSRSLFIYDREGRFKNVIHQIGSGPGEFVRPDDFDIQKGSGNIIILDGNQRKLLVYNKNGDFISDIKFGMHINRFIVTNDNHIILDKGNTISDHSENHIRITDMNGNTVTELFPIPEYSKEITISPRNPLQKFLGDTILFMPSLSDQIYQIHENKISQRYQLDFGKYWPGKSYFEREKGKHPLKIAQDMLANDYAAFFNYLESKDVLHINFEHKHKPVSFYYNKKTGAKVLFHMSEENLSHPFVVDGTSFILAGYIEDKNPILIFYDIKW
jgi:hypothetical protein